MLHLSSPFHDGELAIQDKLGVKDSVASYAPRVIRPYMPDQHREFYEALPYFFIGTIDDDGLPWASMLWGEPGFVQSPDPMTLSIKAVPSMHDPLYSSLRRDREVGMIGLQFHTRRRNRVNGRVTGLQKNGFSVAVTQSFGNCPQYIQGREIEKTAPQRTTATSTAENRNKLNNADRDLISNADTLFIASASGALGSSERHGVDMSHRGGHPGFVKTLEDGSLLLPDFSGNNHFNTIGNIHIYPFAGLIFIDFKTGDILQLSGSAEIVWPENTLHEYEGAQRYLKITPSKVIRHNALMPYTWDETLMSPYLPPKTNWRKTAPKPASLATDEIHYEVLEIVDESADVKSFYLCPPLETALTYRPGQHLPISVKIGGKTQRRTYTISTPPGWITLRITVKRDPVGVVSNYLHTKLKVGDTITARKPAGNFVLQDNDKPAILISAGVGITPMIAMTESILQSENTAKKIQFIHGSRTTDIPFLNNLQRWAKKHESFSLTCRISDVAPLQNTDICSHGQIDSNWLETQQLPQSADYYLCGPPGFMQASYDWLLDKGVSDSDIHFEAFGPASVKRRNAKNSPEKPDVAVTFSYSGKDILWEAEKSTLLEAAEQAGIDAPFSCRSGSCGSCLVKLKKGKVSYDTPPAFETAEDEALLCCAVPDSEADEQTLVIEL